MVALSKDCLTICRDIAPKDTGNLAMNAIKVRYIPNGFQIVYVVDIADYLLIQNVKGVNKGYIDRSRQAVMAYATSYVNGHNIGVNQSAKRIAQYSKNSPKMMNTMMASLDRTIDESDTQTLDRFNLRR